MVRPKMKTVNKIPKTNIVINYWKAVDNDTYFRFMTYVKADTPHLMRSIQESTYKIYSSSFSKWYLCNFYDISSDRIEVLDLAETREFYDPNKKESFRVTAFNANHCVGSLMFLFQSSSFGNVLYTGHFRLSAASNFWDEPLIKQIIEEKSLDVVYFDNTYAAEHCVFPSRSEVVSQIVDLLSRNTEHKVFFCGNKIGKVEVLHDVAKSLKEKVCVSESKLKLFAHLKLQKRFTEDQNECRLKSFDRILSPKECRLFEEEYKPCIIILLTANFKIGNGSLTAYRNISTLRIFPYSGHSSHKELMAFLSKLQPYEIKPILMESDDDDDSVIPECMRNLCRTKILLQDSDHETEPVIDTADLEPISLTKNENAPDQEPAISTSVVRDPSPNEFKTIGPINIRVTVENPNSFKQSIGLFKMDTSNHSNNSSPLERVKVNNVIVTESPNDGINLFQIFKTHTLPVANNSLAQPSSTSGINNNASVENTRLMKDPYDMAFTSDITIDEPMFKQEFLDDDFDFANAATPLYCDQNSDDFDTTEKRVYLNHTAGSKEKKSETLDSTNKELKTGLGQSSTNENSNYISECVVSDVHVCVPRINTLVDDNCLRKNPSRMLQPKKDSNSSIEFDRFSGSRKERLSTNPETETFTSHSNRNSSRWSKRIAEKRIRKPRRYVFSSDDENDDCNSRKNPLETRAKKIPSGSCGNGPSSHQFPPDETVQSVSKSVASTVENGNLENATVDDSHFGIPRIILPKTDYKNNKIFSIGEASKMHICTNCCRNPSVDLISSRMESLMRNSPPAPANLPESNVFNRGFLENESCSRNTPVEPQSGVTNSNQPITSSLQTFYEKTANFNSKVVNNNEWENLETELTMGKEDAEISFASATEESPKSLSKKSSSAAYKSFPPYRKILTPSRRVMECSAVTKKCDENCENLVENSSRETTLDNFVSSSLNASKVNVNAITKKRNQQNSANHDDNLRREISSRKIIGTSFPHKKKRNERTNNFSNQIRLNENSCLNSSSLSRRLECETLNPNISRENERGQDSLNQMKNGKTILKNKAIPSSKWFNTVENSSSSNYKTEVNVHQKVPENSKGLEISVNQFDTNQVNESTAVNKELEEIETKRMICRTLAAYTRILQEESKLNDKHKTDSKGIPTRILEQYSRYECFQNHSNVVTRNIDNGTVLSDP